MSYNQSVTTVPSTVRQIVLSVQEVDEVNVQLETKDGQVAEKEDGREETDSH